jgi:hypothetical protein
MIPSSGSLILVVPASWVTVIVFEFKPLNETVITAFLADAAGLA